jgi:hypothetical protein
MYDGAGGMSEAELPAGSSGDSFEFIGDVIPKKRTTTEEDVRLRPLPRKPTAHPPGSGGKIRVMRWRYAKGFHIHHPDDRSHNVSFTLAEMLRKGLL